MVHLAPPPFSMASPCSIGVQYGNVERGIIRYCLFTLPSVRCKTQQTQHICITFVQRRPNVFDVGPTLYKCYTIFLRLLGILVALKLYL